MALTPAALDALAQGNIENFKAASTPGGIEAQEAAGAPTLNAASWFPKDRKGVTDEELTALGFKLGQEVDEIFVSCEFPPGWTNRIDSSYWTTVFDEKGEPRFAMFYKAAFYDRKAHLRKLSPEEVEAVKRG